MPAGKDLNDDLLKILTWTHQWKKSFNPDFLKAARVFNIKLGFME